MTDQKFADELNVLNSFIGHYCIYNKHAQQKLESFTCRYNDVDYVFDITLCDECLALLNSSVGHLLNCPHEEKPKCRRCPSPCYEKREWKQMAKVMRQSAIITGIDDMKKKVLELFK